jgi:hypothetical protein
MQAPIAAPSPPIPPVTKATLRCALSSIMAVVLYSVKPREMRGVNYQV